jgi:membrane protein YqaA with SNARE-associated domain
MWTRFQEGTVTMRSLDKFFLGSILLVAAYWAISIALPESSGPLVSLYYWVQNLSQLIGYPGAFLVSFIGNVTVLIPFPYIAVIFFLGGARISPSGPFYYDPVLLGIVAGVGATLGEMTGYLLGYFGSRLVDKEQTSTFLAFINKYPRLTPIVLWFLALTPFPDDVVVIPLGVAKYPWRKVLVPQLIGKVMFLTILAVAGRIGFEWVENNLIGDPTSAITKTIEAVALILVIVALYLVVRLNWSKIAEKNPFTRKDRAPVVQDGS